MRIEIRGDYDGDEWYLECVGLDHPPHVHHFTGPFATRREAAHAIPDYRRAIERALQGR